MDEPFGWLILHAMRARGCPDVREAQIRVGITASRLADFIGNRAIPCAAEFDKLMSKLCVVGDAALPWMAYAADFERQWAAMEVA